jgi:hypothetical protein
MSRRFTLLLCAAIAACVGDEDDLDSGPAADGGAGGTGTTGDDASGDDLDGVRLDVGVTGPMPDPDTGGGSGGVSGGSEGGDDDRPDDGTNGDSTTACIPTRVFVAIDEHVDDLAHTADLMAGVPSPNAPVGFMVAPALPTPPATALQYAHPGEMPCQGPWLAPAECDQTHCIQVECIGTDSSWMTLSWLEHPVDHDGWQIEQVLVGVRWTEGNTNAEFGIMTNAATPESSDASMLGYGWMSSDGSFSVIERYFALHEYGDVEVSYVVFEGELVGGIEIRDVLVATLDAEGRFRPTGVCPEPET